MSCRISERSLNNNLVLLTCSSPDLELFHVLMKPKLIYLQMNSGAAPLTKDLVDAVYKRLKIPVKQGYGLTETSPTTHTQPWEDWDKTIGSVGRLLPNQTAKYIGEDGVEVPAGETVCRKLT